MKHVLSFALLGLALLATLSFRAPGPFERVVPGPAGPLAGGPWGLEEEAAARPTLPVAPLFARIFVVGASASSGFLLQTDVGAPTALTDVLAAALLAEHEPLRASTSLTFFLAPLANGTKQIDRALAHEPTLLFALDFLFWFGYGYADDLAARLERLEQGLWLLDKVDGPVVVCDLPDMSPAIEGRGPFGVPMLHRGQVPAPAELERLNAKLAEWAAERGDVVVVPLADFIARIFAGETIELCGNRWEGVGALLRADLLHPSLEGSAALVVLALDRLAAAHPDLPAAAVRWDSGEVARRTYDAKQEQREVLLEEKRAREERRRAPR